MRPRIKCSFCAKDMEFEVKVPSLKAPGQVHYFFSCDCGRVASQAQLRRTPTSAAECKRLPKRRSVRGQSGKIGLPAGAKK